MNTKRNLIGEVISDMTRIGTVLASGLVFALVVSCQTVPERFTYDGETVGVYPGEHWQKAATPEQLGWSSEKLTEARTYSKKIGSAAVMIVDDGVIVDAWGQIARKFYIHSMRKPLMSALIGIHVEEGHIDLSKTLEELGIDDIEPSLTKTEKQATVADLIKSRSGVYHPALGEVAVMKKTRPKRGSHAPGTFWYYNNWDFNSIGTIFEQETGAKIFEEFDRRIAKPIQMEDFNVNDCWYETGKDSIHRYYGFRMSARDLARFGLLYLREGRWQDKQIITSHWVRESTATHSVVSQQRGNGYGYMWGTGIKGVLLPNAMVKDHSFWHAGLGGHLLIVLPDRRLVIVHRVNTDRTWGRVPTHNGQLGRLLWLILDAAGDTEIGENPSIESSKGVQLTGESINKITAGSSLRGELYINLFEGGDKSYMVSISKDGTMSISFEPEPKIKGRWWTKADKCCFRLEEGIFFGRKTCFSIVQDGTMIKLFDSTGTLFTTWELSRD